MAVTVLTVVAIEAASTSVCERLREETMRGRQYTSPIQRTPCNERGRAGQAACRKKFCRRKESGERLRWAGERAIKLGYEELCGRRGKRWRANLQERQCFVAGFPLLRHAPVHPQHAQPSIVFLRCEPTVRRSEGGRNLYVRRKQVTDNESKVATPSTGYQGTRLQTLERVKREEARKREM